MMKLEQTHNHQHRYKILLVCRSKVDQQNEQKEKRHCWSSEKMSIRRSFRKKPRKKARKKPRKKTMWSHQASQNLGGKLLVHFAVKKNTLSKHANHSSSTRL